MHPTLIQSLDAELASLREMAAEQWHHARARRAIGNERAAQHCFDEAMRIESAADTIARRLDAEIERRSRDGIR